MSPLGQLAGDWSDLVVIWADVPWDAHPVLHRRYALGLSTYSPVLYVDPPSAWRGGPVRRALAPSPGSVPGGSRRGEGPSTIDGELRVVAPRVARLTPSLPPAMTDSGGAVAAMLVRRSLRRALTAMGSPTVSSMLSFAPDAPFAIAGAEQRVLVVREGTSERLGAQRIAGVDLVVATSPVLADQLRGVHPLLLLPDGCDDRPVVDDGSESTAPDIDLRHPIAGFVGRLSDRLDLDLLEAVADRGVSLLLVGPCARPVAVPGLMDLLERRNVSWVGPRARSALGPYLRAIDVGLVPYLETEANQRAFPTKTLDHLAAGRPVVSTDLASTRWLRSNPTVDGSNRPTSEIDPRSDLMIASTGRSFAAAVERLGRQGPNPTASTRRRAFARSHAWDRRIEVLAGALGLTPGAGAVHGSRTDHPHGGATPAASDKEAVA